jgi:hypothetical protein
MPYAIIGIIFLGLVIASIRTIVVERGRIRKRLVDLTLRRQQKYLNFLKGRIQMLSLFNSMLIVDDMLRSLASR